ncbi:MAG: iron ABC transporter permease [Sphaerochaetaceae bacterium]|nr:iron ABC transporter permease [Sphaerochaetaceae bacterium]
MNKKLVSAFVVCLPFLTALCCIGIGRYHISLPATIRTLLSPLTGAVVASTDYSVLFSIRLPRILLALAVGMGLAVSGAAFQSMFSNPLATPDTLGVASGAAFGAAIGLLFGQNLIVVQLCALVMGIGALAVTYWISRIQGNHSIILVVLAGIVMSSLFQAFVSFVKFAADPQDVLPSITYWLMGSMSSASYRSLLLGLPFILVGSTTILLLRWRLNIVSLGEDEAKALGGRVRMVRFLIMGAATLVTASCVSMCGQVGWVGLLVPHIARLLCGSDNTRIVPVSMGLGAVFMVLVDTLARSVLAGELPLSILTAVIGAPFFIVLLRKMGGARL